MGKRETYMHQPHIQEKTPSLFFSFFSGRNTEVSEKTGNLNTALPRASSINQVFPLASEYSISLPLFLNLLYLVQELKAMFNMFVFYTDNIKVNI